MMKDKMTRLAYMHKQVAGMCFSAGKGKGKGGTGMGWVQRRGEPRRRMDGTAARQGGQQQRPTRHIHPPAGR